MQLIVAKIADRHPPQTPDRMTDPEEEFPNLAGTSFIEHHLPPTALLRHPMPQGFGDGENLGWSGALSVEHQSAAQTIDRCFAGLPLDLRLVGLAATEARVCDPVDEVSIVGQ